ncbi:MAG: pyrroline-5-carboxylate reductase [Clostridiales bacterium]|nr:pyrroline-5-carboxylate reductase [Clostridiales bacterium]
MKTLGIIGCGNMGGAILKAVAASGKYDKQNIYVADRNPDTLKKLESYGLQPKLYTNKEAASCDILLLAVKPQVLPLVTEEIRDSIDYGKTVIISIAPGYTISKLQSMLNSGARIVRAMPNTPAMVGKGMTAVCVGKNVGDEGDADATGLLGLTSDTEKVPEGLIDAVVGVSGSSPAYVFMMIDALADAAVRYGMPRPQALHFAAKAVEGSAALALESGLHPGQLKDMVCSPAGTTIEAVAVLEKEGFRNAVIAAASAASEKSALMGGKKD